MKKWLMEHFLPMWAKQTLLEDNKALRREIKALRQENRELTAYLRGLEQGVKAMRKISIYTGGERG